MRDLVYEKLLIAGQTASPTREQLGLPGVGGTQATAQTVLGLVFGVIAAAAVIVIILAALTIVTGGNEPEKIARGKRAIIYAFIGLAVALSAELIVQLVLGGFN